MLPPATAQAIPWTSLWLAHIFGQETDLTALLPRGPTVRELLGLPPLEFEMAVQVGHQADLRIPAHPFVPHVGSGHWNRTTSCSSAFPSSASRPSARLDRYLSTLILFPAT